VIAAPATIISAGSGRTLCKRKLNANFRRRFRSRHADGRPAQPRDTRLSPGVAARAESATGGPAAVAATAGATFLQDDSWQTCYRLHCVSRAFLIAARAPQRRHDGPLWSPHTPVAQFSCAMDHTTSATPKRGAAIGQFVPAKSIAISHQQRKRPAGRSAA
jgi:hypothetical protein